MLQTDVKVFMVWNKDRAGPAAQESHHVPCTEACQSLFHFMDLLRLVSLLHVPQLQFLIKCMSLYNGVKTVSFFKQVCPGSSRFLKTGGHVLQLYFLWRNEISTKLPMPSTPKTLNTWEIVPANFESDNII